MGGIEALQALVEACEARIDELDLESLDGLRAGFDDAWRALSGHGPRAHAIRDRFGTVTTTARRRLDEARRATEAERRAQEDIFRQSLATLEIALEQASVPSARAALERLDVALVALGGTPRELRRRETTARQGFATLVARQRWSLNRQRAELASAAEALLGQGLHPDAVAGRVRELREAWDRLDAIARAAGDEPNPESGLARRFRALTGKALAPTRKYFSERQKLRAARATEFESLAAPVESTQADDRTLALRRRAVASALRRLDEVDPARRGELGRRLREALSRIDATRQERAEAAAAARRRLLANLDRKLARADLATALAAAREAESEWARLPRARADVERSLRAEFDTLVGPWFERERAERAESTAKHDATREAAWTIVRALEALGVSGSDPTDIEHRIAALVREWRKLEDANRPPRDGRQQRNDREGSGRRDGRPRGPRPSTRSDPLPVRRYEAALAAARSMQKATTAAAEQAHREKRRALIEAIRVLEAKAVEFARTGVADPVDMSPPVPGSALADPDDLPAMLARRRDAALAVLNGRASREQWLQAADAAAADALELALRAECCAGIESPAEHADARRRVQVARLEARMRDGQPADSVVEMEAIEQAWHALGPLESHRAAAVESRVQRAAAVIRGNGGS